MDVVPVLKPGVVIHFHDIHLPKDYPPMFLNWYWSEQYLVAAYLLGALQRINVLAPTQFLSGTSQLRKAVEPMLSRWKYDPNTWLDGGSLWFTHVALSA